MVEVIILALQLLIPILPSGQSQPLTVFWQGKDITNKPTLIYHDEVETVAYGDPPTLSNPNGPRGLLCSSTVGPIAWHPGNGAMTVFDTNRRYRIIYQIIPSGNLMAQLVRDGRNEDISGSPTFNGLFTCRRNGDISTAVPVGFYHRGGRTVRGVIRITGVSITSNLFMAASPSFTLAGDTENGPPETYTWTRNGAPITNNNSFSISVGVNGVIDPNAYDLSRYRSTLTVTGTLPGMYQYSVSNRATSNTLTSSINIEGAGATAPSNLMARQNGLVQNGVGPVLLSWTLPSLQPVDGYRITFGSPPDFSAGIGVGHDVSSRQISLALGMHSISIRARSRHYPGMVVSMPVTVRAFERPIIMTPSVTANSVTLSWAQPDGTLPSENYVISIQRGTNRPFCSDELDSRQMTTNDQSVVFSDLYGSSSYTATVTATAFGTSMMRSQDFTISASRPVGVSQRIIPSTTSRTITVNWDEITCRERNGAITNYLVELKKEGVGEPIPGMLMINERRFFANGSQIIPFTNYTFRVAGRNMQGQGPYSEIMTIQTMEDIPGPVSPLREKVMFTSIDITWDRPQEPNGIILSYEITYRVNDSTSIIMSTTNPNDTVTFTIPSLTPGTRVSVSVSAYTSVGRGPPASLTNLVTLGCPFGSYFAETSSGVIFCRSCPNNSVSFPNNNHNRMCECLQGYYRNLLESIHVPCTTPPSACRNLRVYRPRTRANTITVRWERPLIIGRDDYYYNIHYSSQDVPGNFTRHNRNPFIKDSSVVQYSVSGLRPLTNYTIRVTVHNGVSDQDPKEEEMRRCEVSGTTGDIRAQAPRNVTSLCCVIVWKAPSRAYGVIIGYDISFFLPGRIESVVVKKERDEFFHIVKEGDLMGGQENTLVMVRAKTASINGAWSEGITLNCSPTDVTPTAK